MLYHVINLYISVGSVIILDMTDEKRNLRPNRGKLLGFLAVVLVILVLLPQLDGFGESVNLLGTLNWSYALLATLLVTLTYLSAAATYYFLAFKTLSYYKTAVTQFAAMFVNRLLPGGVGALGVNYAYLRKNRHTSAQAAAVVGVNNLFGFIGHGIVFGIAMAFFHASAPPFRLPGITGVNIWLGFILILACCAFLLIFPKSRHKLSGALGDIVKQFGQYSQRPLRLAAALTSSISLTLFNMLSLYICLLALGGHLSFVAIVVVFTIGIGVGTATPTPGGLGGLEAGMAAGLIAYGVPGTTALAAVILYRLISYWLTLLIGAVAFIYCQRHNYFGLA